MWYLQNVCCDERMWNEGETSVVLMLKTTFYLTGGGGGGLQAAASDQAAAHTPKSPAAAATEQFSWYAARLAGDLWRIPHSICHWWQECIIQNIFYFAVCWSPPPPPLGSLTTHHHNQHHHTHQYWACFMNSLHVQGGKFVHMTHCVFCVFVWSLKMT